MSTPAHDYLSEMFRRQDELQRKAYGGSPRRLTGEERVQYIKDMTLALTDELHEALQEVGWKPWATSRHLNRDAYVSELIDAWHFLMNLFLVAGVTPSEFFVLYMQKADRNQERQDEGYDGIAGKCPICRRALDDPAVTCSRQVGCVASFMIPEGTDPTPWPEEAK